MKGERHEHLKMVETSHPGIFKEIIVREGEREGIYEISIVTLGEAQEVGIHGHEDFMETWQILTGVGLMSFIEGGGTGAQYNIRLGKDNISQAAPGDMHGITNIGRDELKILVTKTPHT